jgi:FtsH-binding integral membrane protein
MEIIVLLVLSFFLPVITAPSIAKRREDLSAGIICIRYGLSTACLMGLLMSLLTAQTAGDISNGLGAFLMMLLIIPVALLAFGLGATGASLGVWLGRHK